MIMILIINASRVTTAITQLVLRVGSHSTTTPHRIEFISFISLLIHHECVWLGVIIRGVPSTDMPIKCFVLLR